MVIAQFQEEWYNRNLMWLVLYICFFILAKYVDSLVNNLVTNPICVVIGFHTNFDVNSGKELFRYEPPETSWVLLLFVAI